METLFWTLLGLIIYCYFGYPLLLTIWAAIFPKPVKKGNAWPLVSVVVAVWNEADVIEDKIKNFLALDYPRAKLEILIGSDGSSDSTNSIVQNFTDSRVRFFEYGTRRGKMAVLNDLAVQAHGEIILFTDARQNLAEDALHQLVGNFNDAAVGCVSGELVLSQKSEGTAQGINMYWTYEKFLRKHESRLHSMLGATGAIYAIRKNLYEKIPSHFVLDDMYVPFKIIEKGYRAIFDETAQAFDQVANSPKEEYRRKVRTLYGNFQIFAAFGNLFNPLSSPMAIQLFSHKFLRVMVPLLMIALFVINFALMNERLYFNLFILQIIFYAMAMMGSLARNQKHGILKTISRVCYVPYVFCLLNFSALMGLVKFLLAKQDVTWKKARDKK